jgi:hypothetical protein
MDDYPHFGGTCCFQLQKRIKQGTNIGFVTHGVGQGKCPEKGCILIGWNEGIMRSE